MSVIENHLEKISLKLYIRVYRLLKRVNFYLVFGLI